MPDPLAADGWLHALRALAQDLDPTVAPPLAEVAGVVLIKARGLESEVEQLCAEADATGELDLSQLSEGVRRRILRSEPDLVARARRVRADAIVILPELDLRPDPGPPPGFARW